MIKKIRLLVKTILIIIAAICILTVVNYAIEAKAIDLVVIETQLTEYGEKIEKLEQKQALALQIAQLAKDFSSEDKKAILTESSKIWNDAQKEKVVLVKKYNELKEKYETAKTPAYTQEELELLSRIVYSEAGSTWLSDEHQQLVANVVINRVNSPAWPNTIKDVIFQKGQYSEAYRIYDDKFTPDERTIANTKAVLDGLRVCPEGVVYQANFIQGEIYKAIEDDYLPTSYFCYG